ncbi:hypothetical protein BWI93_23485 [Siphonobacter sp. BAB-5385]|uniref:response regulator n=1 Tax=Siphonobacter sp. BAB-5385 TaxID=1864822 RepID=UPI000B9EA83B|nr:response regulator [Siphonobacter sp. BAB-5385]OZI05861.1 hypothetical protein BWI93_23485 [Siphonobacter sp. BAB-5385]
MLPESIQTAKTPLSSGTEPAFISSVKERSDRLMNYFLIGYFLIGLVLATFYDTWLIALGVGGLSLLAYYSTKRALPNSDLYQYVLSAVLGIFMAQYIYQMHGLFEMHFYAFIGSAILITYQKWQLQIPIMIVVLVHHAIFGYLQNTGYSQLYFTRLDYFDLLTFVIHIFLAAVIFFIGGLWAYMMKKYSELQRIQAQKMADLEKEATLSRERQRNELIQKEINSRLVAANLALEKARAEAEKANQAKSVFLATMSHEIRTPMNGVIGMAALLQETHLTSEQRDYTETIVKCGDSLINVINDILDFSKIESGSLELEQEDFILRQCIEDVLDIFATKAMEAQLDLIYQIEEDVPVQIVGDSLRLKQILVNLVGNGIKFTEKGEVCLSVSLGVTEDPSVIQLHFSVRDTGIGIPSHKIGRLFKSFSQVDSTTTRKYGGSGLGLAISARLVDLMGGKIRVDSQPGCGSTFSFTMQCQNSTRSLMPQAQHQMEGQEGKQVLLVDDNTTNLTILKRQFEIWKFHPMLASSGEMALEVLAAHPGIDLVITDMQMPVMDGVMLAEQIKRQMPHLPIILLSSIGKELDHRQRQLFVSTLSKPIRQHELIKHLLDALHWQASVPKQPAVPGKLSTQVSEQYPLTLMVAEDNAINQRVIKTILVKLGYEPDLVDDGQQAVEAASQKKYDLILMDMQMPVMDGLEATLLIRQTLSHQPIVIALTANVMSGVEQTCLEAGMDDYLAKPVKLEELISKLEKWHPKVVTTIE